MRIWGCFSFSYNCHFSMIVSIIRQAREQLQAKGTAYNTLHVQLQQLQQQIVQEREASAQRAMPLVFVSLIISALTIFFYSSIHPLVCSTYCAYLYLPIPSIAVISPSPLTISLSSCRIIYESARHLRVRAHSWHQRWKRFGNNWKWGRLANSRMSKERKKKDR